MEPQLAGSEISRRFDLVGFDPRGVGHSTPALRCQTDAEFDAYRRDPMVDYSPPGVAHIEEVYRQLAQRCLNRNGAAFLENVGTASVARDMDLVRQALGDDQINYLGLQLRHGIGDRLRRAVRRPCAGDGAGRCDRPEPWARSTRTSTSRPGFRPRSTITRRIAPARRTARWAPTPTNGSTASTN